MANFLDLLLMAAAMPALLASGYLLLLAALSRRPAPPDYARPHLRFDLIVPAHDEEGGIAATVRSLIGVEYPPELRRVLVVADNCTDATAAQAGAAGATVLVRHDPDHRGKGYALAHAFERSLSDGFADAVVVVDADTEVTPTLLLALAARLDAGALAIQTNNVVGNPQASWRTRLMAIAFALFNTVRSLGRDRLGCSVGLRGNGMCLATALLREVPHDAFSIVEDLEYGIRLGLAGHRVHFAYEARVASEMVSSASSSRSQRRRWEEGRRSLARRHGLPLVRVGLARRDPVLLDLGLDLLLPPLASVAGAVLVGAALSLVASLLVGELLVSVWAWGAAVLALAAYVLRGWRVSGTGLPGLEGLLHAPLYVAWKIGLALQAKARGQHAWIRTARERQAGAE